MGPKKAKPTPAAGSSTEEPSGAMENPPIITWPDGKKEQLPELPDLHLGRRDLPTLDNEYESPVSYFCMFFSYDSEIEGRKLTREDVHGIMCMVFSERKQQNKVYDKFDNPEPNDGMVKMRKLEVKFRAPWILQVESWYKSLRERDSATEARHEALKGL